MEGCLVCFSEFDSGSHLPSILPCGHSFCCSCLRHPSLSPSGLLRCPLCRSLSWGRDTLRRETSSPVGGVLWANSTADTDIGAPRGPAVPERRHTSRAPHLRQDNQPLPAIFETTPTLQAQTLLSLRQHGAGVLDEAWFVNRCALCCRRHSADSYPLDCQHSLCPHCLEVLLALAAPGWVAFLYCPRCNGQTAVFSRPSATHLPTRAIPEQRPAARTGTLEQRPGFSQCHCCCGIGLPCTLL